MQAEIGITRQFRPEDAEACSSLVRACLELDPMTPPAARVELLRGETPEIMRERANLFYVAVFILAHRVAGVAGVDMNEIRLLFVDPVHQHKGIGGSLLSHVEALVPPALFSDIFVYSTPGAVGFYCAHGYQPGGEYGFHVGGRTVPTVFMTKRLSR